MVLSIQSIQSNIDMGAKMHEEYLHSKTLKKLALLFTQHCMSSVICNMHIEIYWGIDIGR